MVQRRAVITARQGKRALKAMEVLLTSEFLTEHIYKRSAGSSAWQRSMSVDFTPEVMHSKAGT